MTEREALIILNMLPSVGPVKAGELAMSLGSYRAILNASPKALSGLPGVGAKISGDISGWRSSVDLDAELALAEKAGVVIVTLEDESYPPLLKEIHDPPLALYVRGKLPRFELSSSLGIVGTRRPSRYGLRMAGRLAADACHAGWIVVSGLAYGIDSEAHKAAVDAGGITVAVLGGGLARVHPQDHIPLARSIVESGGAVISEFPMERSPNRRTFPMRNRIIAGLSQGLLVVEAGLGSGSLITADFALEQGRLVFAVPGEADNPRSAGGNKLIKDGAILTESIDDILEEFEFLPGMKAPGLREERGVDNELDRSALDLTEKERTLVGALADDGESSADQLVAATGIATGEVLALLMGLSLKKVVEELPGKRFALRGVKS